MEIKSEREMFIYWLLKAYETLCRKGYESGYNDEEMRSHLVDVLANIDYDPNLSKQAKELIKAEPKHYVDGE